MSVLIEAEEYCKTIRASIFQRCFFLLLFKIKNYQESIDQKTGSFIVFEAIIQEKKKIDFPTLQKESAEVMQRSHVYGILFSRHLWRGGFAT